MRYPGPYKRSELTETGCYWWLPAYLKDHPEVEENWSVVTFSPSDPRFHYVGEFYGPIEIPATHRCWEDEENDY